MDRRVTSGASLFEVTRFRQWRAEGKKSERKELGERRVSSLATTFFSAAFLFTVATIWTPGIGFFGAGI